MTAVSASKARSSKRPSVPAPEVTSSSSPGLDALTSGAPVSTAVPMSLTSLRPHPANPRRDLGDLSELADSIRAHGVRQNLLVVPDPDEQGAYRVVIGNRRAEAAQLAGVDSVPVVVDRTLTPAQQLELMLLENIQRTDLTPVEEADGYQGLLDLGLDEKEIAKRTGRSRSTVAARLRLRSLPEPAREKVHAHQATLDDAERLLQVAELAPNAVEQAAEWFGQPDFVHHAQRLIDDATAARERQAVIDGLVASGVRVVDPNPVEWSREPAGVKELTQLSPKKPPANRPGPTFDVEEHRSCPGHVAWVPASSTRARYGCDDWKAQGHHDRWASPPSTTQPAGPDRKVVIENNRAAVAAETVRREWLTEFLARKKFPADALVYTARILTLARTDVFADRDIAHDLLGIGTAGTPSGEWATASPSRATAYLVALATGRAEALMPKDYWRAPTEVHVAHLTALAAWGYPLADVEQSVLEPPAGGAS